MRIRVCKQAELVVHEISFCVEIACNNEHLRAVKVCSCHLDLMFSTILFYFSASRVSWQWPIRISNTGIRSPHTICALFVFIRTLHTCYFWTMLAQALRFHTLWSSYILAADIVLVVENDESFLFRQGIDRSIG